jgi:hypothetical protein
VVSQSHLQANVFEQRRVQPVREIVQVVGEVPDLSADRSELSSHRPW